MYEIDLRLTALQRTLNELIALELAVLSAYEAAEEDLTFDAWRDELGNIRRSHQDHIVDLCECLRELGGELQPYTIERADKAPNRTGAVINPLLAMWFNEEVVATAYEEALELRHLVPHIRVVLLSALEDEQRHYAWLALQVEAHRPKSYLH